MTCASASTAASMSTAGEAGCSSVPSAIAQRRSSAALLWPMASLGITWSG